MTVTQISPIDFDHLDYPSKLNYWDEQQNDFKNMNLLDADENYYSIKPENRVEKQLYVEWVINHWRDHYVNQKGKISDTGFTMEYASFEILKADFEKKIAKQNTADKELLYEAERSWTETQIGQVQKHGNAMTEKVYGYLKRAAEDRLYANLNIKTLSPLMELRKIGQLWDFTLYKIYLEKESTKGLFAQPASDITSTGRKDKKSRKLSLIKLTDNQYKQLYQFLTSSPKFIVGPSELFCKIFKGERTAKDPKLIWADQADNKVYNSNTLFTLLTALCDDITTDGSPFYDFMIDNFAIIKGGETTNMVRRSLSSSYVGFIKVGRKKLYKENLIEVEIKKIIQNPL